MSIKKPLIDDLADMLKKHLGEYPTDFVVIVNRRGICQTFGAFESTDKMSELLKRGARQAKLHEAQGLRRQVDL